MLNRIFKTVLLGVFALVITTTFTSCKNEKETIAAIVVKNDAGLPISHARVVLHAMPLKNSLYTYNADNYDTFDYMIKSNLDTVIVHKVKFQRFLLLIGLMIMGEQNLLCH